MSSAARSGDGIPPPRSVLSPLLALWAASFIPKAFGTSWPDRLPVGAMKIFFAVLHRLRPADWLAHGVVKPKTTHNIIIPVGRAIRQWFNAKMDGGKVYRSRRNVMGQTCWIAFVTLNKAIQHLPTRPWSKVMYTNRDWEDVIASAVDRSCAQPTASTARAPVALENLCQNGLVTWETQQNRLPARPDLPNQQTRGCPRSIALLTVSLPKRQSSSKANAAPLVRGG